MNNNITIPDFLNGTFKDFRNYTKHYAKSFYFSSFALPEEKRNAAYAIYAFCRYADNITDVTGYESVEYLGEKINGLRLLLDEVYEKVQSGSAPQSGFIAALKKYDIPKEYFSDLIDGVSSDITKKKYQSYRELDVYCYKVASVVGLIMTKVFGYSDDEALLHAIDLGKAMQLTNILRDIKDDYSMGRIYIPGEEMEKFGYSENDLKEHKINDNFRDLMSFQINRARCLYESANMGIEMLTDDGSRSTVKMMSKIYEGILDEIEDGNYNIFSKRHYVGTFRKIICAIRIYIDKVIPRNTVSSDENFSHTPVNQTE